MANHITKRKPKLRNADGLVYREDNPIVVPPHLFAQNLQARTELTIVLVGCGGTGSQVLTGLGQIHASLRAMYEQNGLQCRGLNVHVFDPDTVSPFNVGRQMFYETDIHQNKAECLVNRVNMAYGTTWKAYPVDYLSDAAIRLRNTADIVITCVDTAAARRKYHETTFEKTYQNDYYWLDCGNLATVGQVVLGQPGYDKELKWPRDKEFDPSKATWLGQHRTQIRDPNHGYNGLALEKKTSIRLPCVTELFPDILDPHFDETNEPSCSMVDALHKQSLFVNRMVSAYALDLLWELMREGSVSNQGCYFNLRTRTTQPIPLKVWPISKPPSQRKPNKTL